MFDHDVNERKHFNAKDGEQTFEMWKRSMGLAEENFPFRVKTNRRMWKGREVWLNVASWGFYQGSDWRYYVFISYRASYGGYTCAYHWDVDSEGKPTGKPRKHEWAN